MRYLLTLLLLSLQLWANCQKQANIWYYGKHLGLDFSSGSPVFITGGQTGTVSGANQYGSTCISDSAGRLLFYADGETVWNRNHQVMPNGNNLQGCLSSQQGALAIPQPGSNTIFYMFTTAGFNCASAYGQGRKEFRYNVIDMCLNNGLGDIVPGRKNVALFDSSTERLAATRNAAGTGYWVLGQRHNSDAIYAYHLTSTGLATTPVISHIDTANATSAYWPYAAGQMKLSPDGRKLAIMRTFVGSALGLYDFDNATGQVNNLRRFMVEDKALGKICYGLEFSPDSRLLYIGSIAGTGDNHIFQYNVTAGGGNTTAINASKYTVVTSDPAIPSEYDGFQLGPDNKIYIIDNYLYHLRVINNPNQSGVGCNLDSNTVAVPGFGAITLPTFVAGLKYHNALSFCSQASATRQGCADSCSAIASAAVFNGIPPYTYVWTPGNFTTDTITNICPGIYHVTMRDAAGNTGTDSVVITPLPASGPIQINAASPLFCVNDSVQVCAPAGYTDYSWNNSATGNCMYTRLAGNYYVTVTDFAGCTAQSNAVSVGVYPASTVAISVKSDTLNAYSANAYQWYFNGQVIDSATQSAYVAHQPGSYQVEVTDSNGCRAISDDITITGIKGIENNEITIYPNPNNSNLWYLNTGNDWPESKIEVTDATGRLIYTAEAGQPNVRFSFTGASGIYMLKLYNARKQATFKLIKL